MHQDWKSAAASSTVSNQTCISWVCKDGNLNLNNLFNISISILQVMWSTTSGKLILNALNLIISKWLASYQNSLILSNLALIFRRICWNCQSPPKSWSYKFLEYSSLHFMKCSSDLMRLWSFQCHATLTRFDQLIRYATSDNHIMFLIVRMQICDDDVFYYRRRTIVSFPLCFLICADVITFDGYSKLRLCDRHTTLK